MPYSVLGPLRKYLEPREILFKAFLRAEIERRVLGWKSPLDDYTPAPKDSQSEPYNNRSDIPTSFLFTRFLNVLSYLDSPTSTCRPSVPKKSHRLKIL